MGGRSRKADAPPQEVTESLLRIQREQEERRNSVDSRLPPATVKILENLGISKEEAARDGIKYAVNEADKNALTTLLAMSGFRMGAEINVEYFRKRMDSRKIIYHNGCAFELEGGREVWYGDIDISDGLGKLQDVAGMFGKPFAITVEHPYRWQERFNLDDARAMRVFSGKRSVLIPDQFYVNHPKLSATLAKSYVEFPHVVFIMPGEATEQEMKDFVDVMLKKFKGKPVQSQKA